MVKCANNQHQSTKHNFSAKTDNRIEMGHCIAHKHHFYVRLALLIVILLFSLLLDFRKRIVQRDCKLLYNFHRDLLLINMLFLQMNLETLNVDMK